MALWRAIPSTAKKKLEKFPVFTGNQWKLGGAKPRQGIFIEYIAAFLYMDMMTFIPHNIPQE